MPNATVNAATLAQRITALEADAAAQRKKITLLEAAVAQAYATNSGADTALAELAAGKDALAGMIRALALLDEQWHATAVKEFTDASKAINDRTDDEYREVQAAFVKAIESSIAPIFKKSGLPLTPLEDFSGHVGDAVWGLLSAKNADQIRALGPCPKAPPKRLADGGKEAAR